MAEMLELPDQELKTIVIIMLRALTDKEDNIQKQMGNVNRKKF